MKLRLGSALLLAALVLLGTVVPVSAHVFRSDKGISVEMHIPPDDQVTATRPTTLEFNFEDEPATFDLTNCGCGLQVTGAGDVSLRPPLQLSHSSAKQLTSQVLFPKPGDYTVRLTGATTSSQQDKFSLTYSVHVQPKPVTISQTSRAIGVIFIATCAVAAIAITLYYYRPKRKTRHAD